MVICPRKIYSSCLWDCLNLIAIYCSCDNLLILQDCWDYCLQEFIFVPRAESADVDKSQGSSRGENWVLKVLNMLFELSF